jgi:hypothetical protein
MADVPDGYQAYYADKLWALLPSIYRTLDPTSAFDPTTTQQAGPLREIVDRIGATAAVLRRSIDRMWEDQSIESCDDWVIPYIAAQLATNLVSGMDARQQRLDVANTIYYRQRKGTIPVLEEIAKDVTGWEARVVETFRRLGRARHGLDPALTRASLGRYTRTPPGGYADLRHPYGASRAGTPFDELSYTVDVRLGSGPGVAADLAYGVGRTGWHNIPTLAVFVYRLESVLVSGVTPVAFQGDPSRLTFDPTGRSVQLFAAALDASDARWVPRQEYQLPGPIDASLLKVALTELYGSAFTLYANGAEGPRTPLPAAQITMGGPESPPKPPGDVVTGGAASPLGDVVMMGGAASSPMGTAPAASTYAIDPALGTIQVPSGGAITQVDYHYGFSSTIGAGGYDRGAPGPSAAAVTGGGAGLTAIASGTVEIGDSLTYDVAPPFTLAPSPQSLVVQASNLQRPLVRPPAGTAAWTFTGDASGSTLVLDGLFVSGCDVVLAGAFDAVTLTTTTLDPGAVSADSGGYALAADGRPLAPSHLVITGTVRSLVIDRCVLGPVTVTGSVETVTLTDSIVQAVSPAEGALSIATGMTNIARCTVLGSATLRAVEASDAIFYGALNVADDQQGCVRYSAVTTGSALPNQYACVELDPGQPLVASTVFGDPGYAALLPSVDPAVAAGGESGSEMGAFSRENNPIKERSLIVKYQEYMPIGQSPVLIYVT